jgi:uncharacterized membrane protein HdeD (DUF308 family)
MRATPTVCDARPRHVRLGLLVLLLGCVALAAPFFLGKLAPFVLGLLLLGSGALETAYGFTLLDRRAGNSAFLGSAMSIAAGIVLLAQPKLALGALAILLGLSFLIDGLGQRRNLIPCI